MDAIKEQKLVRLIEYYEQRIEELAVRCTNLESILSENFENLIIEEINKLWLGNEELNLRLLFTMQHFQFRKLVETGVMGPDDKPVSREERITLFDIFQGQRESFAAKVKANEEAARVAELPAAISAGPLGTDAPPPDAKRESRSSALILPGDFRSTH